MRSSIITLKYAICEQVKVEENIWLDYFLKLCNVTSSGELTCVRNNIINSNYKAYSPVNMKLNLINMTFALSP